MKTTILSVMAIVFLSLNSFGQSKPTEKQVKKEVKKEVRMEEENGVKTLTIVTTENGKTSEEIFKGEAAEKKMEELMAASNGMKEEVQSEKKEVRVEEINGVKHLKIITNKNGQETVEEFVGQEAEMKLKELEIEEPIKIEKKKEKVKITHESM
jgi:hypothetical protein